MFVNCYCHWLALLFSIPCGATLPHYARPLLQNSPITKLRFVIPNECEESLQTLLGYFTAFSMTRSIGMLRVVTNLLEYSSSYFKRAVRSHSTACDDGTFRSPKECRRLPLCGGGVYFVFSFSSSSKVEEVDLQATRVKTEEYACSLISSTASGRPTALLWGPKGPVVASSAVAPHCPLKVRGGVFKEICDNT